MSDDLIINLIWGVMALEQKFAEDPYSLSLEEINILKDNKKTKFIKAYSESKKTALSFSFFLV